MKYVVIMLLLVNSYCFSQSEIQFNKKSYDFGAIVSMNFPPATFSFKNNSTKPVVVITTKSAFETKVQYQRVYIQPGETGIIYVKYESQQLGEFSDEILVYFNLFPDPVRLTIKGNNISVAECFPDKANMLLRVVHVIDMKTKEPIPGAYVNFFHNGMTEILATMDEKGQKNVELPIGMYEIDLKAEGYKNRSLELFIPKSLPIIFLEMEPLPKPEPVVATIEPVVPDNSFNPEPDPVSLDNIEPIAEEEPEPAVVSKELPVALYRSNNIVFVIDISLSMKKNNRMTYLKKAMFDLVDVLRNIDNVTIITYNNDALVNIEAIAGNQKTTLKKHIRELYPEGLTNGVKGLDLAYSYAQKYYKESGNNQLILATDGEFTGSQQSEPEIASQIRHNQEKGIIMSIVGFGDDKDAINRLKKFSKIGGGQYLHISSFDDTVELLIDEVKRNSYKEE